MQKSKSKKAIYAILASGLVAAVVVCVVVFISLHREKENLDLSYPFESEDIARSADYGENVQISESFASDLCVSSADAASGSISLSSIEKAGLFSIDDKTVVYASGIHDKVYPASVTKIMTAILALKYGNLNDTVTINWEMLELESGSQVCGFKIGDKVKMSELFRGLLVHSGNDAAMAIAYHVGGTISNFVSMMNKELSNLGATESHFTNPSGLHDVNHYTSVYDIYLMLNKAISFQEFQDVIQLRVYELKYTDADGNEKTVTLDSTDQYLTGLSQPPQHVEVIGGKTGTTDEAGSCLALLSQNRYGKPFISIVLGASSKPELYDHMNQLLQMTNS